MSSSSSSSTTPVSSNPHHNNFASIHDLNMELDRLAELCGDSTRTTLVSCAADCEALYSNNNDGGLETDIISFNTVLKAWSKVAGSMLEQQQQRIKNINAAEPQVGSVVDQALLVPVPVYTPRDAAARATQLLMDMEQAVQHQNNKSDKESDESETDDEEEETTVRRVIVPDRTSYNVVIDAWAKSRAAEAPREAEALLDLLKNHDTLEPDTLTYNGVLQAWVNSHDPQAMTKIQQIYNDMVDRYATTKSPTVKPTIRTVNTIMHGYAKRVNEYYNKYNNNNNQQQQQQQRESGVELAMMAHDLLKDMKQKYQDTGDEEYRPDVMSYTSVMDAYSRCGQFDATLEAQALLEEVEALYQETGDEKLKPNFRTYTSMIVAWSKVAKQYADAPHKGEALLERMEQLANKEPNNNNNDDDHESSTTARPNARSYTAAIQCWAKSRDKSKAQRALRLLKKMKDSYKEGHAAARPNLFSYNAAIDACARCPGNTEQQTQALKIAFAMLKSLELEEGMRPNHVTYSTLLKAVAFLLPAGPERNTVATAVFEKCQKAGMVEDNTLKCLRMAMDNKEITDLLHILYDETGKVNYDKVPRSWRRNVV